LVELINGFEYAVPVDSRPRNSGAAVTTTCGAPYEGGDADVASAGGREATDFAHRSTGGTTASATRQLVRGVEYYASVPPLAGFGGVAALLRDPGGVEYAVPIMQDEPSIYMTLPTTGGSGVVVSPSVNSSSSQARCHQPYYQNLDHERRLEHPAEMGDGLSDSIL
jgi:hypothetical protein